MTTNFARDNGIGGLGVSPSFVRSYNGSIITFNIPLNAKFSTNVTPSFIGIHGRTVGITEALSLIIINTSNQASREFGITWDAGSNNYLPVTTDLSEFVEDGGTVNYRMYLGGQIEDPFDSNSTVYPRRFFNLQNSSGQAISDVVTSIKIPVGVTFSTNPIVNPFSTETFFRLKSDFATFRYTRGGTPSSSEVGITSGTNLSLEIREISSGTPKQIPITYSTDSSDPYGFNSYYGFTLTNVFVENSPQELYFGYDGGTYPSGVTFSVVPTSLVLPTPPIPTEAIQTGGFGNNFFLVNFAGATFTDSNYPSGVTLGFDTSSLNARYGGIIVRNSLGAIETRPNALLQANASSNFVYPGATFTIGYLSDTAKTFDTNFSLAAGRLLDNKYLPLVSSNFVLPGITFLSSATGTVAGTPTIDIIDLGVFNTTSEVLRNKIYVGSSTTAATFTSSFNSPISTFSLSGLVEDFTGAYLGYSNGGETLSIPDLHLALTGTVTSVNGQTLGSAIVSFSNILYGDSRPQRLVDSDGTEIPLTNGNGTYTYTNLPGSQFGTTFKAQNGGLALSLATLVSPLLTFGPPGPASVTTTPGITFSIQPNIYYVGLRVEPDGATLNFSDTGVTYITTDVGLQFGGNDYINNPSPNTNVYPLDLPYVAGYGYKLIGNDLSNPATWAAGEKDEFYILYGGNTYSSGITAPAPIAPSLTLGGYTLSSGGAGGSVNIAFGGPQAIYTDINYPAGIQISTDAGNMVSGGGIVSSTGLTLTTAPGVVPGQFIPVGYQSQSAIEAQTRFAGGTAYFLNSAVGVTLPGITYTNLGTTGLFSTPEYRFNLSVMGLTDADTIGNLSVVYKSTNFPVAYSNPTSSAVITGATYDVSGAFLAYSAGGSTLALPTLAVGLTGSVVATTGTTSGTAVVDFTNIVYGGSNFTGTLASRNGNATIVSGSGTQIISGLPGGSTSFNYSAAIPGGTSINFLTSNPVTVVAPRDSSRITLNYVYNANAGNTFAFNLLGEVGYTGITFAQTITLGIPSERMNRVLAYAGNWGATGPGASGSSGAAGTTYYQPVPVVALLLQNVVGPWLDDFSTAMTGGSGTTYKSTSGVIAGYTGTNCYDLPYQFQSTSGFTYSSVAGTTTGYLPLIPQEAITSYRVTSVETKKLSKVIGNVIDEGNQGQSGPTAAPFGRALQSLFEQAVTVGLVQVANETNGMTLNNVALDAGFYILDRPPGVSDVESLNPGTMYSFFNTFAPQVTSTTPIYGIQWSPGQELAFYIRYDMTKNRVYNLTPLDLALSNSTGPTQLVFGGQTFTLNSLSESSGITPVTYKIVLQTV